MWWKKKKFSFNRNQNLQKSWKKYLIIFFDKPIAWWRRQPRSKRHLVGSTRPWRFCTWARRIDSPWTGWWRACPTPSRADPPGSSRSCRGRDTRSRRDTDTCSRPCGTCSPHAAHKSCCKSRSGPCFWTRSPRDTACSTGECPDRSISRQLSPHLFFWNAKLSNSIQFSSFSNLKWLT